MLGGKGFLLGGKVFPCPFPGFRILRVPAAHDQVQVGSKPFVINFLAKANFLLLMSAGKVSGSLIALPSLKAPTASMAVAYLWVINGLKLGPHECQSTGLPQIVIQETPRFRR